ncbi:Tat pathway signal sequence domain protein [Acetobacteraceae bacterium AT-5844]|nr:Tat pathway signal sequence domain protein [Acetobacteraceae bacterium AT-5844]
MTMTRRSTLSAAAGAALSGTMLSGRRAAAQAVRWQLASASPADGLTARNLLRFIGEVREISGQGLDIRLHPSSSLLRQAALRPGLQTGEAQLAEILLAAEAALDPVFEMDAIPRLARGQEQARRLAALCRPVIERRLQREGLSLLCLLPNPPGGLYTGFPVESLAMLRGTRMRVRTPIGGRLAMLLGATPAPLEPDETEAGFAARMADIMFASVSAGVDVRAWTFSRYFTAFDLNMPAGALIAQTRALEALPPATRAALREAAASAEARGWTLVAAEQEAAPRKLEEQGMVLRRPSAALERELQHMANVMLEEWLARAGEGGRRLLETYRQG